VIVARAEHVKNGRSHKIVLEDELAEIIERCWTLREIQDIRTDLQFLSPCFTMRVERSAIFARSGKRLQSCRPGET
jgi:hypothetical protein